jgi:putative oxidoreductase
MSSYDTGSEPKLALPFLKPFYDAVVPLHWPLLRCAAALIMLVHGVGHLPWTGFDKWSVSFVTRGYLPVAEMAYGIMLLETVGALCVAIGLFTRFFAAGLAIELGVMTFIEFWPNGFSWNSKGYEYALLWGLVFLAIALRGGGPYSLDRKIGKEL